MTELPRKPDNAVVILLDSLNRHMVGAYGATEFATPTLDALAERSVRFDRHYSGSLPCMPARHDILVGALDFLWRPWGSIEMWEHSLTACLRGQGVVTKLVSDHPHLFETGGENYHTDFTAWDYVRGHENDPWQTWADPTAVGAPVFNRGSHVYDRSRSQFREEEDYPGPKTMAAAERWLETSAPHHDRFLLFIDEFDPHEPFDVPEPYATMYDPSWEGPHLLWSPYMVGAVANGTMTPDQGRQVRAQYGGKLTMIDRWVGRVLDALDRAGLTESTAIILCTDHGHYLGERDIWGKPPVPLYEEMARTPLLIAYPGVEPRAIDALSTNVDLFATLIDLFDASAPHHTHGRSLLPLVTGEATSVRDHLLAGIWGREVNYIDASGTKYARGPVGANAPISMWSNRWSTMPIPGAHDRFKLPSPDERAWLDRMPHSTIPVIRQPFRAGDMLPYWAGGDFVGDVLFRVDDDPAEEQNLVGTAAETDALEALRAALQEVEAPDDQLARLGIA